MTTDRDVNAVLGDDQSEWPEVAIVVLNWNNYEDTAECLESLETVEYPNFDTIVVDNGSKDGSGKRLQKEFSQAEFIFNEENLGFAAGNNVGIDKALQEDTDYILLLNNDTVVRDDFLTPLVKTAEFEEDAAIVGGVIYESDTDNIWFSGARFIPSLIGGKHLTTIKQKSPYESDFVTGAMMLTRADFLEEVEGLNEDYFFGHEDIDLSFEARSRGWTVLVTPQSKINHKVGGSAGSSNPFRHYHATWNRLYFAKYNLTFLQQTIFYVFFALTRILRFIQWSLIDGDYTKISATVNAINDFFTSSPPKYD